MKSKRGFSLIELLVVVLIIGILTSMALPGYEKATRKAHFVQIQTDLTTIMRSVDEYVMANGYKNTGAIFTGSLNDSIVPLKWTKCLGGANCYTEDAYWVAGCSTTSCTIRLFPLSGKFKGVKGSNGQDMQFQFTKDIENPNWKWNRNVTGWSYSSSEAEYGEFFQFMCDWWVKQGGRPISDGIKEIAEASCGI